MKRPVFHLLPNAHLDPVWLWDWREGLDEAVITTRTILDLMDEDPALTFLRGEAVLYRHIETHDPALFARLRRRMAEGRWDVVGGTWLQPDTNLPATETFVRHFVEGQRYFRRAFGRTPRVAWAADSFGHSGGLVEILAACGIQGFSFSRPGQGDLPLRKPAFWWEARSGARVLAYRVPCGWYGTNRHDIPARLDATLECAKRDGLRNVGVYIGLGNHGGGPTRRQLADARAWAAAHPDVEVRFSGLHRLFAALRRESASLPVVRGELNFCLRGCYASMARFKFRFRQAEALLGRAERIDAAVAARLGRPPADLGAAWRGLLFNSFHDILPGSSIERAYDEQLDWLGGCVHAARVAEHDALGALARRADTRVPAVPADHPAAVALVVFNPHPRPYGGPCELEASLDYRPIREYDRRPDEVPTELRGPGGRPVSHQCVATEHQAMRSLAWRKRVAFRADVPPMGWQVYTLGWVGKPARARAKTGAAARADGRHGISNGLLRVTARPGTRGVAVRWGRRALLAAPGLHALTVEDPWGSWGSMGSTPSARNLSDIRHTWRIARADLLERGPERAALHVRLTGGASTLDLLFRLWRGRAAVDVEARLHWNERSARLKLVMPGCNRARFEVPGGVMDRDRQEEMPGGRWVEARGVRGGFGFASDAVYAFDLWKSALRATLVRATGYADDVPTTRRQQPLRPATDRGEHRFRFLLAPPGAPLADLADELERPPVSVMAAPARGPLGRRGSLVALEPAAARLLALKPAADGRGFALRVQLQAARAAAAELTWLGQRIRLGRLAPWAVVTFRLSRRGARWRASKATAGEVS
ncbi:MAG: alpha-mannosidase [Kiritimatiellae bacterium]|nr:alpha-mannosidase [Kiritimatiellia bacterium]